MLPERDPVHHGVRVSSIPAIENLDCLNSVRKIELACMVRESEGISATKVNPPILGMRIITPMAEAHG